MEFAWQKEAKRAHRLAAQAHLARLNARRLVIQASYLTGKARELHREARLQRYANPR